MATSKFRRTEPVDISPWAYLIGYTLYVLGTYALITFAIVPMWLSAVSAILPTSVAIVVLIWYVRRRMWHTYSSAGKELIVGLGYFTVRLRNGHELPLDAIDGLTYDDAKVDIVHFTNVKYEARRNASGELEFRNATVIEAGPVGEM